MKGISEEVMKFSIEKFERADLERLEREVDRLTAENARLREVLGKLAKDFADVCGSDCPCDPSGSQAYDEALEEAPNGSKEVE